MEQRPLNFNLIPDSTTAVVVTPPSATEGARKVKNISVSLVSTSDTTFALYWALVYVPQGTQVGSLNVSSATASLYEPNQYVMNCGISDPNAGPIRFFTPLARNLNSGDAIYLLVSNGGSDTAPVRGTARYAISY